MKEKKGLVFTNGVLMVLFIVVFAYLGGAITNFCYYLAPCIAVFVFALDAFDPKFKKFMDSRVKLYEFFKVDFKPNFIKSYMMLIIMLIVILTWAIVDLVNYKTIKFDVLFAFFSVYVIFSIMILLKYYNKYEKLP